MIKVPSCKKFDKTLTKKELDAFGYLNFSNDTLGRLVKAMASDLLINDVTGFESIKTTASCYALIHTAASVNAGEFTQKILGFTDKNKPDIASDWEIIVRKISK